MAKRIFEVAKELGVESKAIIAKCVAEGIPEATVKNHMATLSAGLVATIKEWFSQPAEGEAGGGTAVETTAHVDLQTVRAKPKARARPLRSDGGAGDAPAAGPSDAPSDRGSNGSAVAPAPIVVARESTPSPVSPDEADDVAGGEVRPAAERAFPAPATPTRQAPPASRVPAAKTPSASPAPSHASPAHPGPATASPAPASPPGAAPAASGDGTSDHPARAVAKVTPHAPAGHGPSQSPEGPAPTAARRAPVTPVGVVNVPTRPTTVTQPSSVRGRIELPPRGSNLRPAPGALQQRPRVVPPPGGAHPPGKVEIQSPVKLSGPKVVRIEAPEQIDVRAPRRFGPPGMGPSGPRGGGGVTTPGSDDDRRQGARNKRRTGPGAGPEQPAAQKRKLKPAEDAPAGAWSEQDLIEREARLAHASGFFRQRKRDLRAKAGGGERALTAAQTGGKVSIAAPFTIKDLSAATGVKAPDLLKKLFLQGVMATVNSGIDPAKAAEIMIDFNIELDVQTARTAEEIVSDEFEKTTTYDVLSRPPVITVMGHVDHGKTSLLDRIRNANVASGEAGGITQKVSAFRVPVTVAGETKALVFFDTPGHQAFTEMRARGANITDLVVLVVAADDGVMPQTVECISHAKAADVPIVVALNKIDKPEATEANIRRIYGQLAEQGLNPVEWGGTTEIVKTSAAKGEGITQLLEMLDLQAQVLELTADFGGPGRGSVIEATRDEGRGALANVLVQDGQLKVGDIVVAGRAYGRVRDMTDDRGNRVREAGPATPVQISGLDDVPDAGDRFYVVDSLAKAQEAAEHRQDRERLAALQQPKVTLDSMLAQMKDANVKEILIVLKADAQGSVDVIKAEIERLSTAEVKVRVLHAAVGGITESDITLASASRAVIVGFNVIASSKARSMAEGKSVEVRTYQVIYDITDDVKKAAAGMLEPEIRQEVLGHAEVRKVFRVTKVGAIAGCYVTDGIVQRDALVRITRQGIVIENDRKLEQLKRFKDDAKEVRAGNECGMKIVAYDDIKEGDVIECYKRVEVKRTL